MSPLVPAQLPTGTNSLPPLGGRLFVAYRFIWWALLSFAASAAIYALLDPGSHPLILTLRLAKSAVLIAVAGILFRRRQRDAVAATLGLSFLLWTVSSSVNFIGSSDASWIVLLDRLRFLPFALALLLFPHGEWRPRVTGPIAAAIFIVFIVGAAEAMGVLETRLYLPLAIGCVLLALGSLLSRYRSQPLMAQQQLKWVMLGLVIGIGLILSARAGAALSPPGDMPMEVLLEGLFQGGIVVIALGFLTSLLRYRLYDAEAAISRSAAYAGLTLALVGTFAASESIIQTLGQRYFGPGVGDLSGGIAAAIAAVLLTPLHGKISNWAEQHFQRDLTGLKTELPDLLAAMSGGSSLAQLGAALLPRIEEAIHSARSALLVDDKLVAVRSIAKAPAQRWLDRWVAPQLTDLFDRDEDRDFPVRMALHCPFGKARGWLLLGRRPDGSLYGSEDLDALAAIAPPLRRALFSVAERERERRAAKVGVDRLAARISKLEAALMENGYGCCFGPQGTACAIP
jgi:hypothetical protein